MITVPSHLPRRLLFGFCLTLLLGGCAARSPWKQESFAFNIPYDNVAVAAAHTNILSLSRVTISPLFAQQKLVYRTGENSYEEDPYAQFLVPPNRMLDECLLTCLRNGHTFAEVLDQSSSLKSSCSMEVSVSQLYGDFRQRGSPLAVLEMRFALHSTDDRQNVLWQGDFSKRLPLFQSTPAALLAAWNTCLEQIMEEVNLELTRLSVR